MSTCTWEETEYGAEYHRKIQLRLIIHSLIDSFKAYFPRQQATDLQSKPRILNICGEQHPPEHLGTNLKNNLCHQAYISRIKHAEFCARTLDSLREDLEIQALEVIVQSATILAEERGLLLLIDRYQDKKVELSS